MMWSVRGPFAVLMMSALLLVGGCSTLRAPLPRVASSAITQGDQTTLGRTFHAQAEVHPGQSGFQILSGGQAAFTLRAALADAAERTLDLQYYSVGDDLTSNLLLHRIAAAADRGVRVRILLDDAYPTTRVFAQRAAAVHPSVQVRMFNPFYFGGTWSLARLVEFAFDDQRLNRRMHNKLWVADNAAAIVGSRNLGDEYFGAYEGANFNDVDLFTVGPVVRELSTAFDAYWSSTAAVPLNEVVEPLDASQRVALREALQARVRDCDVALPCTWVSYGGLRDALRSSALAISWARAKAVYDPPDDPKSAPVTGIEHRMVADAPPSRQSELLIVSPYFIPGEDGRRHLAEMARRGTRVAVLTNSLASTDVTAAHAAYARYRVEMLNSGIELYESRVEPGMPHRRSHRWGRISPASLHAKIVVQDRAYAIVGSLNQDPRSRLHNTEAWIEIDSTELANDLVALFAEATELHHAFALELDGQKKRVEWKTEENGEVIRYTAEPGATLWLRMWSKTLGALVPEHLL
jgi:putative cardiolipin synthase